MDDDDDLRAMELYTLEAIFPEIVRLPAASPSFSLELPVVMEPAANVLFQSKEQASQQVALNQATFEISHLPSLTLRMDLVNGYPESSPPRVHLAAIPAWIPQSALQSMESEAAKLWEDLGRDMTAYAYVEHLQHLAEDAFGMVGSDGLLRVDDEHKLTMLDYNIKAKQKAMDNDTFECGVCLDPKKGSSCHMMKDCSHVFCLQCLQDFYNDAITTGDLTVVRCLAPGCAKERADGKTKKHKTAISPSELLNMGLTEETVKRYVMLKYKTELESDKNTIYCPRSWCNGAARSKKHKKPAGLEFQEASDVESEGEEAAVGEGIDAEEENDDEKARGKAKKDNASKFNPADLLSVCEDCSFAFCSRCKQSWHGEFVRCVGRKNAEAMSADELASLEYLKLHTSPCPTCGAPAQKTHGCNHMLCSRCETHFCYLCSEWLDPANPYKHYNTQPNGKVTSCYMRLWELEGGDGDDVGLAYHGGEGPAPPPVPVPAIIAGGPVVRGGENNIAADQDVAFGADESDTDQDDDHGPAQAQGDPRPAARIGQPGAVAREAPLVLRLFDDPGPNAQPDGGQPPQQQAVNHQGRRAPLPPAQPHQQQRRQQQPQQQQLQGQGGRNQRGGQRGRGGPARGRQHHPANQAMARGEVAGGGNNPNNNHQQQARRGRAGRGGQGGQGGQAQHQNRPPAAGVAAAGAAAAMPNGELGGDQADWVRRFVAMALQDVEDLHEDLPGNDDDDDWFLG